ncbi:hypothetical protein KR038_001253 [Drosophila bunnanda]|nr:hypothetical protein KR038_001253 [Drosophila bunnanda]
MGQNVVRQPYPNDCHRYYETSLWSCPPNFYWNDLLKQCQEQQPGGCSSIGSNSTHGPESHNIPSICNNKAGQLIAYPGDCTRFIHCDYLPFVKACPKYLFWNSRLQTCDKICV